ncbi:hypothetical protein LDH03_18860, partial [Mycobacterium tuberculosis]
EDVELATARW